mgnify:FL=1|jgi:hypothetical protein
MSFDLRLVDPITEPTVLVVARVAELLDRKPEGSFVVVVEDLQGDPVVIRNGPFMNDGRPMPTRYWLINKDLIRRVSVLEGAGGVGRAEESIDSQILAKTHESYAEERNSHIAENHEGPRPFGGVGGTRRGVKCLHAHLAHCLAGGSDPVGEWVIDQITEGTE